MVSACAASRGPISASISRIAGELSEPARVRNTAETRRSTAPERSSATTVLSNVGSPAPVIASTSARCSATPAVKAGRRCSSRIAAKSGKP
jgi:hypothetical protein